MLRQNKLKHGNMKSIGSRNETHQQLSGIVSSDFRDYQHISMAALTNPEAWSSLVLLGHVLFKTNSVQWLCISCFELHIK